MTEPEEKYQFVKTDKRIDDVYGLTQSCWYENVKKIT